MTFDIQECHIRKYGDERFNHGLVLGSVVVSVIWVIAIAFMGMLP